MVSSDQTKYAAFVKLCLMIMGFCFGGIWYKAESLATFIANLRMLKVLSEKF